MTDSTLCAPTGDITIFEIAEFKAQLQAALDLGQGVTIDLGHTGACDISVLQLLVAVGQSKSVQFINVPIDVVSRLTQMGWDRAKELVTP